MTHLRRFRRRSTRQSPLPSAQPQGPPGSVEWTPSTRPSPATFKVKWRFQSFVQAPPPLRAFNVKGIKKTKKGCVCVCLCVEGLGRHHGAFNPWVSQLSRESLIWGIVVLGTFDFKARISPTYHVCVQSRSTRAVWR